MSALDDLIAQVQDEALRERLAAEAAKLVDGKKFGLVFEEHIPERAPLYDVPIRVGSNVALKGGEIACVYTALKIEGDTVLCASPNDETKAFNKNDLVAVAEFGEPIYPALEPIDAVQNGESCGPWHALIEAENYHALQLLQYTCAGQVDCIYIDPPYNTGAKDWKYNNDYVDGADAYRHSKWLSMMKKRLVLAKKLLRPDGGMMITTIDDNEYATLYLLLQEIFSEYSHTTISIQMNPGGTQGKAFSVTNEYAIVTYTKKTEICRKVHLGGDTYNLRRWGGTSNRHEGATCFYPVILNKDNEVIGFGDVLPDDMHPSAQVEMQQDGTKYVWPLDIHNTEKKWRYARNTVESVLQRMFVVEAKNRIEIMLRRETEPPKTMWVEKEYNAEAHGTKLLKGIIGKGKFSYPKSLYAVKECLALGVANNPQALILDFFAGSATTLHAVNLLNAEDGGKRRCILVTNNEVSAEEAQRLSAQGLAPGDEAWEAMGIARYVAWPRTVCSIKGQDVTGAPLKGSYLGTDRPMSAGFEANAAFFKLTFVDKTSVSLGRQFKALLPLLWMKAGCVGRCPALEGEELPQMLVLPQNAMAVLLEEGAWPAFDAAVREDESIGTVFIITDSESSYRSMIAGYGGKRCFQLYRDYLENFRINSG